MQQRARFRDRARRDGERIAVVADLKERDADIVRDDAKLLDGGGAIDVARDEQRTLAAILQMQRELAGRRRLAGALQSDHHHDRGRADERESDFVAAKEILKLVANDFRDLLRRRECGEDILADRFLANAIREFLDDFEVHVGFEQRDADLFQRVVDVPLVERRFAAQRLEDAVHLVLEIVEHASGLNAHKERNHFSNPRKLRNRR